jgi:hypothetical protein
MPTSFGRARTVLRPGCRCAGRESLAPDSRALIEFHQTEALRGGTSKKYFNRFDYRWRRRFIGDALSSSCAGNAKR